MESFFSRYKNPLLLMAVLFVQVIMLATQVKRPDDPKNPGSGGTRLIRVWAVNIATPVEKTFIGAGHLVRNTWHNYVDLHDVRNQNRKLQADVDRLRMEQAKLKEDAEQARRLQALLEFKEKFIGATVAAQVIGTSGSEQSRVIYIDKGAHHGLKQDMAVITPDGIVGKVKEVYFMSSQVLLINDRDSGAGVILEKSRLQGDLHGSSQGETLVKNVMSDEKVDIGDHVVTSGGDRIYPKGLPVGVVTAVNPDPDRTLFLSIAIKPATNLSRLEEVLVVTKMTEELPNVNQISGPIRAADILAQRLPTVPKVPEKATEKPGDKSRSQEKSTGKPQDKTGAAASTQPAKPAPNTTTNQPKKSAAAANSSAEKNNTKPLPAKTLNTKTPKKPAEEPNQSPQAVPPQVTKPDKPVTEAPPTNAEKPPE
ncbi:MAG TPA: rod shape-determining protein MreC [Candidatus Angelobacter sp.]|jgi:rod shape-determining protein MreC|nr:rod shape-determining protein MreC [Candidatus Angelobacter sp.]